MYVSRKQVKQKLATLKINLELELLNIAGHLDTFCNLWMMQLEVSKWFILFNSTVTVKNRILAYILKCFGVFERFYTYKSFCEKCD